MKDTYPLVSIAIITYNQKEYLRECIESCLTQDYPNFEIVIADDCSTDGTQAMLREYEVAYPNKFVLRLSEKNQGITPNSNAAHFACSGKYIAWMGGDDLMLPGKLNKQVDFMERNPNCTICYHNLDVFDSETGKTLYFFNNKLKINGNVKAAIRYGTFNGACSNMVRAEKTPVHGYNKSLPVASDWLYWVETLSNGGTIDYIDAVLGKYRRHSNNITCKEKFVTQNELDHLVSCQIMLAKLPQYFNDIMYIYSKRILGLRHNLNYITCLWRSFCLRPSIKVVGGLGMYLTTFGKVKL
ncbi:glycosyltransferase [Salinivibrio sp. EAGSL]|uniref:glycosyltransferase family 2 protein n=1 Tax=Salinivibrio sp. EAGSL TaxID=2738468 RepID=UPI001588C573|nr:glycosyltransferase [Salinivibrio sp. EAGSL]NUY57655.1 glycosyltransferase [Salinivibrio sp. EAGSL]